MANSKKLVVLGASGGTGRHLINEALQRGHQVTAIIRNFEEFDQKHENLKVIAADVFKSEQLAEHLKGADAVLSGLGVTPSFKCLFTCTFYSTSCVSIIEALRAAGVKRFIPLTAWGTKDIVGLPFAYRFIQKPTIMRQVIRDMYRMEEFLFKECNDINYTIVRPPKLTDSKSEGDVSEILREKDGYLVMGYKRSEICRHDLAKFMLHCLETTEFDQAAVAVTAK